MKYLLLLLSLVLVGCDSGSGGLPPLPPSGCTAILTWEPPYDTVDGTLLTPEDLQKFTIYVSLVNDVDDSMLITVVDITDPNMITWQIDSLDKGNKYFYMTVTDTEGRVSTFSNILGKLCA